ncbi:MAG: polysaccharide biosynthesis protein [Acidimicrobiales bacterium]
MTVTEGARRTHRPVVAPAVADLDPPDVIDEPIDDHRRTNPLVAFAHWVADQPRYFPFSADLLGWPVGLGLGAALNLRGELGAVSFELLGLMVVAVTTHALLGLAAALYRGRHRIASRDEVLGLVTVWAGASSLLLFVSALTHLVGGQLATSALLAGCLCTLTLLVGERVLWRRCCDVGPRNLGVRPTIVFGAGPDARLVVRAMARDPRSDVFPVAVLDDNPRLQGRLIEGVPVLGGRYHLLDAVDQTRAEVLVVADPGASSSLIADLEVKAVEAGLELRVMPPPRELSGPVTVADLRRPTIDDLFARDPMTVDTELIGAALRGRRVLITGAAGVVGAELAAQVAAFDPAALVLVDHDENALRELTMGPDHRIGSEAWPVLVADVRDRERVDEVLARHRPEVVFHAAALIHLPLLEQQPGEAVKTNTLGTKNLLDAAVREGVERFVHLSTDKAADPTSVLGATALAAEKLTALAAAETGRAYVSIRFGNVFASRGGVVATFCDQVARGGPVTVTHPDAVRYFAATVDVAELVLQAGAVGEAGEVLLLDLGHPVRIADLAARVVATVRPGTPIEVVGLRPGEKLHETLLSADEAGTARSHPRIVHTTAELSDPYVSLATATHIDISDLRHLLGAGRPLRLVGATRNTGA